MKCGNKNCQNDNRHDTVVEVRACYGFAQTTPPTSPQLPPIHVGTEIHRQVERYTHSGDPAWESADGDPEGYGDPQQRTRIPSITDWSKFKQIPAGYYATPSLTGNNDLDFWKIEKGKGRWEGYTFIKRVIGGRAPADLPRGSKKKVKSEQIRRRVDQAAAFQAILDKGIEESNELFGLEMGYCRECGLHLTDAESRALGIGPVCREK